MRNWAWIKTILFVFSISVGGWCGEKIQAPSQADLDAVTARGRLLVEYDQAAWHSTDAVQALHPSTENLGRFIAMKNADGTWSVAFGKLNLARDKFMVAFIASQASLNSQNFKVTENIPPEAATGFYLVAARAIETALKDFAGEHRPYNVAVLPASENQLYVYVYPAQTKNGVYPLGGDARYLISANGENVVEIHQMHKSILEWTPGAPDSGTTVAGVHTHVLSDVPEDTDVFFVLSRSPKLDEYVGTEHFTYDVQTTGDIKVVEKHKSRKR